MAITVGQIPQAVIAVDNLKSKLNDIQMLLNQAKELSDKGWQVDIGSRFSLPVTIPVEQRSAMVAQYDTFKAELVTLFAQLP